MKMLRTLVLILIPFTLFAAACGDDDDTTADDTTSTTAAAESDDSGDSADDGGGESSDDGGDDGSDSEGRSHTEVSPEELEIWQADLAAVGCYPGAIDGALGPQTEAAIQAFQAAKGLTVDGLLGPQTEGALTEAVAAGETVCQQPEGGDADGGGDAASGPSVSVSSASYGKDFVIGSCTNSGETDLVLQAEASGNNVLLIDASGGTGTLSIDGGTEEDGIILNGTIDSVTVGDAGDFTVTGTFGEPNNVGETFTVTGSCAGA